MKKNIGLIIYTVLLVVLFIGIAIFYIVDLILNKAPWHEHIFQCISVEAIIIGTLIRMYKGTPDRGIAFYEKAYRKELGEAFLDNKKNRKKLLLAVKHYNENSFKKALGLLSKLYAKSELRKDRVPVLLITALCYSDIGDYESTEKAYLQLLRYDPSHAQAHSNLGSLYIKTGKLDEALSHFNSSIQFKADNYSAYVNRANWYFRVHDFERAVDDAHKALSIKNNGTEALNLLAIIYSMVGDKERAEKYFHLAVTYGVDPTGLKASINYYKREEFFED